MKIFRNFGAILRTFHQESAFFEISLKENSAPYCAQVKSNFLCSAGLNDENFQIFKLSLYREKSFNKFNKKFTTLDVPIRSSR